MRRTTIVIFGLVLVLTASADTVKLGDFTFFSEDGPINIGVFSGVAARNLDKSYVMFMLFMGADFNHSASVMSRDIVLVHEGIEYEMPTLQELRENYSGDSRDMTLYDSMVKTPLEFSGLRYYKWPPFADFFPTRQEAGVPIREASISGSIGFRTRAYFMNPGIKKGDTVFIKVRDKDDISIWGGVAIQFPKK